MSEKKYRNVTYYMRENKNEFGYHEIATLIGPHFTQLSAKSLRHGEETFKKLIDEMIDDGKNFQWYVFKDERSDEC